jgi:hypothetical protein
VNIEPEHLYRYLDEENFRFNNRHTNDAERFAMTVAGVAGKRLTYKDLISAPPIA